mmetsp:Transcript_553/g.1029  ORF Transcript_553/g.1029 Transcript_553/m.1029 type:complete len:514 (-) Transcript_553:2441-3982(-)|eukprot:scaffold5337_cov167-Amphora_coffeaeformis.AAC.11
MTQTKEEQRQGRPEQTGSTLFKILGKLSGSEMSAQTATEMEDMSNIQVVSPLSGQQQVVGGFDSCPEYAYTDEQLADSALSLPVLTDDHGPPNMTYLLGKTFHPINHYAEKRDYESSMFWFTYRCDFPEIKPYGITSDAGWGCMIRSAQMLLAQTLRMHYKSREWRPPYLMSRRRQDPFMRSMLTWFADYPSATENVYSLQNMVAAGIKYDKLPGEWYGPGSACYVIRDLVELHERQQQKGRSSSVGVESSSSSSLRGFRVHVAQQGAVYRDIIQVLMTRENKARWQAETAKKHKENPQAHPLDLDWEEELIESVGEVEWDTALLLLVPLRLGLKTFNEDYLKAVAHTFSFPQSVGILGGRERGARWFYGASADGKKVFGLDPHTVQSAPRRRTAKVNGKTSTVVDMTDDYMRSVHTTYPEVFSFLKTDPSIAMGFYCRTQADLEDLFVRLNDWKENNPSSPELFTVADASPDYAANVSSVVNDMLGSSLCMEDDDVQDHDDAMSEEDDYVLL